MKRLLIKYVKLSVKLLKLTNKIVDIFVEKYNLTHQQAEEMLSDVLDGHNFL